MSLPSQPLPSVPDDTARIARAAFRRGNPYVLLRDKLGAVFANAVNQRRCRTQETSTFSTQSGADQRRKPLLTHKQVSRRRVVSAVPGSRRRGSLPQSAFGV